MNETNTSNTIARDPWADAHEAFLTEVAQHFIDSGEWPEIRELQRRFHRRGDRIMVSDLLAEMPRALGWRTNDDRVELPALGLYHCANARDLLERLLCVVELAIRRFDNDNPRLHSADVREQLGLSPDMLRAVGVIAQEESHLWMGGHDDPTGSWERIVSDNVLRFSEAKSVDDYFAIRIRLYAPMLRQGTVPDLPPIATVQLTLTPHPIVATAAEDLTSVGSAGGYRSAVREAIIALRDDVRHRTGRLDLDDADLIGVAFGGSNPMLCIGDLSTESGTNLQRAGHRMAEAILALRNVLMHEAPELSREEAMEMLAIISWVARRVETARIAPSDPTS